MKQIVIIIAAMLLLVGAAAAENLGTLSTADQVIVWCKAIDTAGLEGIPDSGHVLVSFNREATANSASYSLAWTNAGASGTSVDSVRFDAHTYYYFTDLVADIDNDEGNGVYYGDVVLYTDGLPWHNKFTFTLAGDEFTDYMARIVEILDTLKLYDNWVGQQTEIANLNSWNPTTDSTHVNGMDATKLARLDSLDRAISKIFQTDTTGQKPAGSFGRLLTYLDSLNNLVTAEEIASKAADSAKTRTFNLDATGLDNDTSFTNMVSQLMQVYYWVTDSTFIRTGYPGRTILPWFSHETSADADTLWMGVGNDTLGGVVYPHTGGSPGDPPTAPGSTFTSW
jgi:hypothetical protein